MDTNIIIALFADEADVKNRLAQADEVLPENDIWIPAVALQYTLILVTRDAHFKEIEKLQTVVW